MCTLLLDMSRTYVSSVLYTVNCMCLVLLEMSRIYHLFCTHEIVHCAVPGNIQKLSGFPVFGNVPGM